MATPRITVIIPTRERCDVLESSLRTVTSQDYDNLEIIVSDNCSNDDTEGVVRRANDSRIRYLNTGERLSMSHNWEFALSHVEDGWVTFMGDDDGLLPGSISRIAEIVRATQAQAVRTEYCTFDWPGLPERPKGQLIVPLSGGMEKRNSHQWLCKALAGRVRYSQLPMIYNGGFIHFSLLRQIYDRMGSFFLP
jgi:glycosyltransferase involved in cell wall biosynthesis